MKRFYLLGIFVFFGAALMSQGVAIKPGTTPPASSVLELGTTDKGFLMPRMDSTAKVGIVAPANALWLFQDKQDSGFYYYDATYWRRAHQTFGAVQMDNVTSTVISGQGFSVNHLGTGVDDVFFTHYLGEPISHKPEIIVTGEKTELPLGPHNNEGTYCIVDYGQCTGVYAQSVTVSNLTTGANNFIQSSTGACATPSVPTYYNHGLVDNSITNCVSAGDMLSTTVTVLGTNPNKRISVWVDYNGDGDFGDAGELITVPNSLPALPGPNVIPFPSPVPSPGLVQGQFTRMRIMVRTFANTSSDSCQPAGIASSSAEVEDYYIPFCASSYPTANSYCSIGPTDTGNNNNSFRVYCEDFNGNPVNVKYHFKVHEK